MPPSRGQWYGSLPFPDTLVMVRYTRLPTGPGVVHVSSLPHFEFWPQNLFNGCALPQPKRTGPNSYPFYSSVIPLTSLRLFLNNPGVSLELGPPDAACYP